MDRRQLISRLPFIGAAVALPSVAIAAPAAPFDLQGWLDGASRQDVALYHLTQLALAMETISGGQWKGTLSLKHDFALVSIWDRNRSGVFINPHGGET